MTWNQLIFARESKDGPYIFRSSLIQNMEKSHHKHHVYEGIETDLISL